MFGFRGILFFGLNFLKFCLKSWLPSLSRLRLESRRLGGFTLSFFQKESLAKKKLFLKWVNEYLL